MSAILKKSTSEPVNYADPKPPTRKQALESLLSIGSLMSNVCFNLGQRGGRTLGEGDADLMSHLRKRWDAAKTEWLNISMRSTSKQKAKR